MDSDPHGWFRWGSAASRSLLGVGVLFLCLSATMPLGPQGVGPDFLGWHGLHPTCHAALALPPPPAWHPLPGVGTGPGLSGLPTWHPSQRLFCQCPLSFCACLLPEESRVFSLGRWPSGCGLLSLEPVSVPRKQCWGAGSSSPPTLWGLVLRPCHETGDRCVLCTGDSRPFVLSLVPKIQVVLRLWGPGPPLPFLHPRNVLTTTVGEVVAPLSSSPLSGGLLRTLMAPPRPGLSCSGQDAVMWGPDCPHQPQGQGLTGGSSQAGPPVPASTWGLPRSGRCWGSPGPRGRAGM